MFITPPLDDMFTPSQPASQSYVELRSALEDFLIFLDRLRSAKKCASALLLPDFLMGGYKCIREKRYNLSDPGVHHTILRH